MADINYLKDRNGNIFYPRTVSQAVYLPNGESLASLLNYNPNMIFKNIVVATSEPPDKEVLWLDPEEEIEYYKKEETYSRPEINALINQLISDSVDFGEISLLIDDVFSETSTNAVENRLVTAKFKQIDEILGTIQTTLSSI